MKIIVSESKLAKSKYPESETSPYNPWAVCNKSTGGKKESPEKFERCVHHLKEQNRESHDDDMKDIRGRTVHYRTNEVPDRVFQDLLDKELSGEAEQERSRELDDVWMDALRRHKDRHPVFVATAKKNK